LPYLVLFLSGFSRKIPSGRCKPSVNPEIFIKLLFQEEGDFSMTAAEMACAGAP
jgi:hypothetical protein